MGALLFLLLAMRIKVGMRGRECVAVMGTQWSGEWNDE